MKIKKNQIVLGTIVALSGLPAFGDPPQATQDLDATVKSAIEEARNGRENPITKAIKEKFPDRQLDLSSIKYHEETQMVDLSTFDGHVVTVPMSELRAHSPNVD